MTIKNMEVTAPSKKRKKKHHEDRILQPELNFVVNS